MGERLKLAEDVFGSSLQAWPVGLIGISIPVLTIVSLLLNALPLVFDMGRHWHSSVYYAITVMKFVSWTAAAILSRRGLTVLYASARPPPGLSCGSFLHKEAAWSQTIIMRVRAATTLSCETSAIMLIVREAIRLVCEEVMTTRTSMMCWGMQDTIESIRAVTELACLLAMVGFFRPVRPIVEIDAMKQLERKTTAMKTGHGAAWAAKVRSLAQRSIAVGDFLRFYEGLREIMPHYDPWRHTTNDVVRGAIIPLSRTSEGGMPYAMVLDSAISRHCVPMSHAQTRRSDSRPFSENAHGQRTPQCMVTHDWRNLFLHLVAAVVADALGLDEYEATAVSLASGGVTALELRLQETGTLHQLYWICAFCLNQHASICGSHGQQPPEGTTDYVRWDANRRDTVTKDLHTLCACKEAKFFNDFPDECEMNKFDDVMAFLRQEVPDFRQVVAVDRDFNLFTRLWCIAELVEAHLTGIAQKVCIMSSDVLDVDNADLSIYVKLVTLTVTQCSASRPEDKAGILAKIPDVSEFDAQLQAVIFGERGLLSRRLIGCDVMLAAIQSAGRVRAALQHLAYPPECPPPDPSSSHESSHRICSVLVTAQSL